MSEATGPPAGLVELFKGYKPLSMDTMHTLIAANRRLHSLRISCSIRHKLVQIAHIDVESYWASCGSFRVVRGISTDPYGCNAYADGS